MLSCNTTHVRVQLTCLWGQQLGLPRKSPIQTAVLRMQLGRDQQWNFANTVPSPHSASEVTRYLRLWQSHSTPGLYNLTCTWNRWILSAERQENAFLCKSHRVWLWKLCNLAPLSISEWSWQNTLRDMSMNIYETQTGDERERSLFFFFISTHFQSGNLKLLYFYRSFSFLLFLFNPIRWILVTAFCLKKKIDLSPW